MIQLERVLFPTDFSDLSLQALRYARSLAETYSAELHVIHVVDEAYQYWMAIGPNSVPMGPSPEELIGAAQTAMGRFVEEHMAGVKCPVITEVCLGRPFIEIIQYARNREIQLIVVGTHGRSGLKHALLGSVAERVVRKAPCPVLTVRDSQCEFVMP